MKLKFILPALLGAFLISCGNRPASRGIVYQMIEGYTVNDTVTFGVTITEKITTQERFDQLFVAGPVRISHPEPIDFSRQFVVTVITPASNRRTTVYADSVVRRNNYLEVVYSIVRSETLTYSTRPALVLVFDKRFDAEFTYTRTIDFIENGGVLTRIEGYPAQDYSDITWLGGNRYAVVTDKKDGFFIFHFDILEDASVANVERDIFFGDSTTTRDCEGIAYHPVRETVFISGEEDQNILEYHMDGTKTGDSLAIPDMFRQATNNYGFEALTYSASRNRFWTTTESTLPIDGEQASSTNRIRNLLRLQSFDATTLQPLRQFAYRMERPEGAADTRLSAIGVPALTALPDGRLLVLEREFFANPQVSGIWVKNKLFLVDPRGGMDVSAIPDLRILEERYFLRKTLLWEHKSDLRPGTTNPLANFEGMCLGPVGEDGESTLILINDAQGGLLPQMGEYLMVLKF